MTECLPDFLCYIRQRGNEWQGADHPDGPWRPIPAPQSGLPWPTDGPAVQSREPASVVPEATGQPRSLSPAAQAVLDAFWKQPGDRSAIAAALKALADQDETLFDGDEELMPAVRAVRTDRILAIAAELEGAND